MGKMMASFVWSPRSSAGFKVEGDLERGRRQELLGRPPLGNQMSGAFVLEERLCKNLTKGIREVTKPSQKQSLVKWSARGMPIHLFDPNTCI